MYLKAKKVSAAVKKTLIAPCGMNCLLCMAYPREKKQCPGCRGDDTNKSRSCAACIIKNCVKLAETSSGYCFNCEKYPCLRLRQLDKRYRTKYSMSMIENLEYIRQQGITEFIKNEEKRWTCPQCGGAICVHRDNCLYCGYKWR